MELGDFVAVLALSVTMIMKGGFLMIVANRIVAGLIVPIFEKKHWDKFFVMYVSWAVSGLLASLGEINLFGSILPPMIWGFLPGRVVGIILTAIVAGGGANLIDDLVDAIAKRGNSSTGLSGSVQTLNLDAADPGIYWTPDDTDSPP